MRARILIDIGGNLTPVLFCRFDEDKGESVDTDDVAAVLDGNNAESIGEVVLNDLKSLLAQARAIDASLAKEAAEKFMLGNGSENPKGLRTREEIDARLRIALGGADLFWPRWLVKTGQV